jgi:hypothetical protein
MFKPQVPNIPYTDAFVLFTSLDWIGSYLTEAYVFTFLSNCKLVSAGFSIWLWIFWNQSKNIIYSLQGLVDPEMPRQCVQSVFLLAETTCGTGLV